MDHNERIKKLEDMLNERREMLKPQMQDPDIDSIFSQMEYAAFRDGTLSRVEKELIAIGIAVALDRESALEWLIKQALDHGADRAKIEDAIGVGSAIGGTVETARGCEFARKVLDFYS